MKNIRSCSIFNNKSKTSVFGKFCLVLLCAMLVISLASCGSSEDQADGAGTINTLADLEGKRIGSLVGSTCLDDAAVLAGETGQVLGFNSTADLPLALNSNKIDAYVVDGSLTMKTLKEYPNFKRIDETIRPIQYGFIFSKTSSEGEKLRLQANEFLAKITEDGTLDAVWDKWTEPEDEGKTIDYSGITGENGKISIATSTSTGEPCEYVKNGELAGVDIDLMVRFCTEYGYEPDFKDMDFGGVLAGITTNKYLVGAAAVTITEERAESVNFSDPYYDGGVDAIVKGSDSTESVGFFQAVADGFKRTLIDEGRWKLFVNGALTTLFISLCSLILGTLLGFAVFVLCRNGGKVRNKITNACIWFVSGMPAVVLLMIMFYIVFAALTIGGVFVAVISFTLIFGAATIGMLRTGKEAIDEGQTEAGIALGYNDLQTFNKIVLPQIIKLILPTYQSEAKELLKGTAIVGYIAVQDLTKVGDIVRSATYDAIFPLLIVAAVYFLLEYLLKKIIKAIDYYGYEKGHSSSRLTKNLVLTTPDGPDETGELNQEKLSVIKQSISETFRRWANEGQEACKEGCEEKRSEIVRIEHLNKSYGDLEVLKDINLTIYEGDVISVIGPSGCGKSTLLRCLNFLDPPTSGTIIADGLEITQKGFDQAVIHAHIGTVFQRWNLFGHWTVIENLMRPQMDLLHLERQEAYDRSVRALITFGLHDKGDVFPHELSGGQQQRVAIIRTLLLEPKIIVLDEPTSALDPCMVGEVQLVLSYYAKRGATLLIVSHDMNFSRSLCNRAIYIDEKHIYEEGTTEEIFDHPKLPRTRGFINKVKCDPIDITSFRNDFAGLLSRIEGFCIENRISVPETHRMKQVFITLGMQILLPQMKNDFKLTIVPAYFEKTDELRLVFFYTGERFDPQNCEQRELWDEVKKDLKSCEYNTYNEDGYTNWFITVLKKDR